MSKNKLKLTGFARFFIAMLFIAPMAYFGASYYNGQDGIQDFKEILGLEEPMPTAQEATKEVNTKEAIKEEPVKPKAKPSKEYVNSQIKKLKDDLAEKESRVEKLYLENEELKKQLKEKENELSEVTTQLNKIKSAIGQ